jgi:hypothetical protein
MRDNGYMNRHVHRLPSPLRKVRGSRPGATGSPRPGDPVARYLCVSADGTVHYFLLAP